MSSFTSSSKRSLLLYALTVPFVLAALLLASEWLVRAHVLPVEDFPAHRALYRSADVRNVALGDSHVARGFAPRNDFINLAFPSEAIPQTAWKARQYFSRRTPEKIILQADAHLFAPYRLTARLGNYPSLFADGVHGLLITQPRYRARMVGYWSAFLRNGGTLKSKVERTSQGALLSPGNLSAVPERRRLYDARARVRTHRLRPHSRLSATTAEYIALVDFLAERGAELCFVSFPLSPDYRAALAEAPDAARAMRTERMEFFRAQAERVGARYLDNQAIIFDRAAFRDVDHLNGTAAPHYAETLKSACFDAS